jgi:transaldolase
MVIKLSSWVLASATFVNIPYVFSPSRQVSCSSILSQTGEIKALAGVDFLTISPALLEELKGSTEMVPKKLDAVSGVYPPSYDSSK